MSSFKEIWMTIEQRKLANDQDTTTISKALPMIKWIEAFCDHIYRCIDRRYIPLAYIVQKDKTVPAICSPLTADQLYLDWHRSVKEDMINLASHSHRLY